MVMSIKVFVGKKAVVAYFKMLSWHSSVGLKKSLHILALQFYLETFQNVRVILYY